MGELVGYRKCYRLRTAVQGKKSIEVTFPYEVVDKEARSRGLTINEFLSHFQAIAQYDNFEGVLYTFEKITEGEEPQKEEAGGGKRK